jgi:hypothetical protein
MQYRYADSMALYQMIAKNVGIRRSQGRFVLATNIDILFSDELVSHIAQHRLEAGRMYRLDRHDVMADVPIDGTVDEQLAYCRSHLIRVNTREGTFDLNPGGRRQLSVKDIAEPDADANGARDIAERDSGIHLGLGWFAPERDGERVFRWVYNDAEITVDIPPGRQRTLMFDIAPGPGVRYEAFTLQAIDGDDTLLAETRITRQSRVWLRFPRTGENVRSIRLRVVGGGGPTPRDPRTLNFQIFRCAWSEAAPRDNRRAKYEFRSVPFRSDIIGGVKKLARRIAEHDSSRPLEISVPEPVVRSLRACLRAGGIRVDLRPLDQHNDPRELLLARFSAREDIFQGGSGISLGTGWRRLEHIGGETFRRVSNDAELLVCNPHDTPRQLSILIEPDPEVNFKPFELEVLDQRRSKMVGMRIEKLQPIEIPIFWPPKRGETLYLHVADGDAAPENSRLANFRLFWLGWPSTEKPDASTLEPVDTPIYLHTNACGDFTLMAREHWFELRGYPEFDMFSFNIDSLLCYAAHHAGAREEVLPEPMRIYHIEHGLGSGWTPEGQAKLFDRIRAKGIEWVEHEDIMAWGAQMRRLNSPFIFNRENWGLADIELQETNVPATRHAAVHGS